MFLTQRRINNCLAILNRRTPMKITYFVITLAATLLVRDLAAQEETPTPSTSTNSRVSEKSPVSVNAPPPRVSATIAPTYRPRPDTTSRITPTPVPPFNPFDRNPYFANWHNSAHNFANGVRAEILGDDLVITDAHGRRSVTHKHELNHQPPGAALPRNCGHLLHWLLTHDPGTYKWRYGFCLYVNNC